METLELLWGTVLFRPYVFLFLAGYVVAATFDLGWKRTLLFLIWGYGVAFASEYSSIHNGFPYGTYAYLPDRFIHRELWINGEVPFMDSLSYVFLNYAAWSLARFWRAQSDGQGPKRHTLVTVLLGAALVTWLDMIIDPVSLRGEEWFLGKIYHYPGGGAHFGVPWTNYAGWFITGCAIQGGLALAERKWPADGDDTPARVWMGAAIYAGVALFILSVAWWIDLAKGEGVALAMWNSAAFALVAGLTWGVRRGRTSST